MEITIPHRLATLGHPQRLAVFRLLMRRYPDRVPATELANALSLKPNTLSTYVSALKKSELITQERVGTSLRYGANLTAIQETFEYLLRDCCRGRPDICAPILSEMAPMPSAVEERKFNVLFICTGNSARSIFAEAILRKEAGAQFNAYSAGTKPKSELNPFALDVLAQKGHDITELRAKNIGVFQQEDAPEFDFVFTVCDQAANEDCPAWTGQPISAHWGVPDPVKAEGSNAEQSLAFQNAYGALLNRIRAFSSLPIASLDRISLQQAIDEIAKNDQEGHTA